MKNKARRIFAIVGLIGLFTFVCQGIDSGGAKDLVYPTHPIDFYISYAPGGTTDLSYRAFLETAKKYIEHPCIPINKPGAGGTLAAAQVMIAKPDGYVLATCSPTNLLVAPLRGAAQYKDFSVFTIVGGSFMNYVFPISVTKDQPWKTWKELIEWARKNPGAVKLGIPGPKISLTNGLTLAQVEKRENVKFTYVPRQSSTQVLTDTLGGHIDVFASTLDGTVASYIKQGTLRVLAFMDTAKMVGYENIPSFQELYGFSIYNITGIIGPKGLPDYVLEKWDDVFAKVVKDPDFVNAMKNLTQPIVYMNRVQVNNYLKEIYPEAAELIKVLKAEEEKAKQ